MNKKQILLLVILIIIYWKFLVPKHNQFTIKTLIFKYTDVGTFKYPLSMVDDGFVWLDGSRLASIDCKKDPNYILEQIKKQKWNEMPVPENFRMSLYGEYVSYDGSIYYWDRDKKIQNKIENGYWFFLDIKKNIKDDYSIVPENGSSYIIIVYDSDNEVLYYYESVS